MTSVVSTLVGTCCLLYCSKKKPTMSRQKNAGKLTFFYTKVSFGQSRMWYCLFCHTWREIFVQLPSIIGYLLIITLPSKSKIQSNIIEWRSRFCHFSSHFCSNSTPSKLLSKQYCFDKYLWFIAAVEPDSIFKTFKSMYYIDLKIHIMYFLLLVLAFCLFCPIF